jgi:hypothetical protein
MSIYRLIYISSGVRKFDAQELAEIQTVARKNNTEIDVTGMLLYIDGNFLQLLEGKCENVEAVYERILLDKRHRGVISLSGMDVEERLFPDWAMGLKTVSPGEAGDIEGLFRLDSATLRERLLSAGDPLTKKLIDTFLQVNA